MPCLISADAMGVSAGGWMCSETCMEDRPINAQTGGARPRPSSRQPPQGCSGVGGRGLFPSPQGQASEGWLSSADAAILPMMDGSWLEPLFQFVPNLDSRFTHNSPCQGHKSPWTIRLREWRGPSRKGPQLWEDPRLGGRPVRLVGQGTGTPFSPTRACLLHPQPARI